MRRWFLAYAALFAALLASWGSFAQLTATGIGGGGFGGAAGASFLLDTVSATAVVAYSSRKLRSAYAGSAYKIRESGGGTTQNIGFTGGGDLDTTALASFVGSNNGTIDTWFDQSASAANATQSTAGSQVQVVNAGVNNTLNGHVSGLWALTPTFLTFSITQAQPFTIAIMFKVTNWNSGVAALTDNVSGGGNGTRVIISGDGGTAIRLYAGNVVTGGTQDNNSHAGFAVFVTGANSNLYIDGTNPIANQDAGAQSLQPVQAIGEDSGGGGIGAFIAEYIVFSSALGTTDRATIRTSWQNYWGAP